MNKVKLNLLSIFIFFSHSFICFQYFSFAGSNDLEPNETIESHIKNLRDLYNQNERDQTAIKQQVLKSLNALFDFNRLSAQFLQNNWTKMSPFEKEQLVEALKTSFVNKIYVYNKKYTSEGLSSLILENQRTKEKSATLEYSLGGDKGNIKLTISMLKYHDAAWKITNVKAGKKDLRQQYYSFCKKLLDDYSLSYLIAELKDSDYVVLEDFEDNSIGQLPQGWTWRDKDRNKNKPYKIKEENGNKYLAWAFIEAANFAIRFNATVKRYYQRKLAKTNVVIAKKTVAHKLARACFYVLRDHVEFDVNKAFGNSK